jgi:4-aminobutyrate aminotransferase-like enzyme
MAVQPAELIKSDQDHLIHPLHHPSDHLEPMVYVKGRGATITDIQGREYIDGLAGLWNVERGHGREELAEAAATQMGELAVLLGLRRVVQHPRRRAGREAHLDLVPEHAGRLLHLRRGGVQRVRVQDGTASTGRPRASPTRSRSSRASSRTTA